jgi:hypothetical protein
LENRHPLRQVNETPIVGGILQTTKSPNREVFSSGSRNRQIASGSIFLNWGPDRTKAAMELQKAVLESYEQMSRVWLERMQSEVSLWSDKASTTPKIAAKPCIR